MLDKQITYSVIVSLLLMTVFYFFLSSNGAENLILDPIFLLTNFLILLTTSVAISVIGINLLKSDKKLYHFFFPVLFPVLSVVIGNVIFWLIVFVVAMFVYGEAGAGFGFFLFSWVPFNVAVVVSVMIYSCVLGFFFYKKKGMFNEKNMIV